MLKQILIIEQDEQRLNLLSDMLNGVFEIQHVKSCTLAFDLLRNRQSSRISAVLVNLTNGVDEAIGLLSLLNGTPGLRDLPILVQSDSFEDIARLRGVPRGIYDYLQAPLYSSVLLFRLKNLIERGEYAAYGKYRYIAEYDAVSGIYNRERFFDATKRMIESHENQRYVVGWFDIDRFKAFNDLFGMKAGDRLLAEIGRFFRSTFDVNGTYGRVNADHFVFCLSEELFSAEALIERFVRQFASYQTNFVISPRVGVYQVEDAALDVSLMCDRAYMALRSVKTGSVRRFAYYSETMRNRILEEQMLIGDVLDALQKEQFEVFLQPQYNHQSGALVGAEALVRWNHPTRGMIQPSSFIPILEKNGLITHLDIYVWTQTCRLLKRWREEGLPQISVSVNVSRVDIQALDLCQTILRLTEENGVTPQDLRLEITESAYMENADLLIESIRELQSKGFFIEMDDFGKGQSSLNALKNVPVDVLKLDLGFLTESGGNGARGGVILNAILHMAHWLNLTVIAEGVETLQQADYLCSLGCEIMQGYLFARPMPAGEFELLLKNGNTARFSDKALPPSRIDATEFWNPDAEAASIFRHFLGAAGIFELNGNTVSAIRSNRKLIDLTEVDFSDLKTPASDVLARIAPDQRQLVRAMLVGAATTGLESTGLIHYQTPVSRKNLQLFLRVQQIGSSASRRVFLVAFENITPPDGE